MLCLQQRDKNVWWEKVSSTNGDENTEQLHVKEWNWIIFLHHTHKKNTKWIEDLNVRPEPIRHTEGHIGNTLLDISFSHIILDPSLQTRATKAKKKQKEKKRNKQDYIKLKNLAEQRKLLTKKWALWMGEDNCEGYVWWGVNIQNT